ncbi:MAG: DEAD/DEAH box helicase [Rhodospirillaceae bacterium]|jgi:superfamily II DNA/RNA helicase|nr:DEAD/DEAH box helicase [Rhodospirillaceae bacterium]MBT6509631.1 DEAD/DEAH box helicase [Rhodospirillaceae bacterium]MBT7646772.1 DEAD/DEAH box helicase [Rhodospirillaceae bacterium]
MTFEDLGLSPEVLAAIQEAGYQEPTPIQKQAIPVALQGRDLLGCAQTGTGKTAAFVLPLIDILAGGKAKARMPRALILSPTRELAQQTLENFQIYAQHTELDAALLIGGNNMRQQEQALARNIDILIATPGRLLDMIERGKLLMMGCKHLVIDEADRMLDMGFIPDVEKICSILPPLRHTLMFSATMPREVRKLAERFLHNPKEVTVAPPASPAETVEQWLVTVGNERDKGKALRQLLASDTVTSCMIFSNRKKDVDSLHRSLKRNGFNAVRMQGDMAQREREVALNAFKSGEANMLVCTDVAGRGIDVFGVSHVFCYDVPVNAEDYVHRIGRTGRAGHRGRAYVFATPDDVKQLQAVTRLIKRDLPLATIEGVKSVEIPGINTSAPAPAAVEVAAAETESVDDAQPEAEVIAVAEVTVEVEVETQAEVEAQAEPDVSTDDQAPAQAAPRDEDEKPGRRRRRRGGSRKSEAKAEDASSDETRRPAEARGDNKTDNDRRRDNAVPFGQSANVPAFLLRPTFADQDAETL